MDRWKHQTQGVRDVIDAIDRGERRICLTSPTGGGKSLMVCDTLDHYVDLKQNGIVYTNRQMLVEQLSRSLDKASIGHGIRAAGHDPEYWPVQIASIQTDISRVLKRKKWELHDANIVFIDEAHLMATGKAREIIDAYVARGAAVVGVTATPLDLGDTYTHLIQAGTTSELFACGALVRAQHFGPDEPNLKVAVGKDPTEKEAIKAMMTQGIFGRVIEHFNILNPTRRPTILFAPGVKESVWFAQQFVSASISAAHIDGEEVWTGKGFTVTLPSGKVVTVNAGFTPSNQDVRDAIGEASRLGIIVVVCNRFVLREGIDWPWLVVGILATVFGSLQSYLQAGGRLLRFFLGKEYAIIIDHGGHWHRLGSLNEDRLWELGDTNHVIAARRIERLRSQQDREPKRCPKCTRIVRGRVCLCGQEMPRESVRPVVQSDGKLKMMKGDIYKPTRKANDTPDNIKHWIRCYYRAYHSKNSMTFTQAEQLFAMERNWGYPQRTWPKMPKDYERDFWMPVREVPTDRLR